MFDTESRYFSLENKFLTADDGDIITYKKRRFLPKLSSSSAMLGKITFVEGDRLDLITARVLGDPLSFWQIADVNTAMHPKQLTAKAGTIINVPLISFQN